MPMSLLRSYMQTSEFLDDRPDMAKDWKWLLAIAAIGYCCALGLRVMDAKEWLAPALMAGDEVIMSTHDAYGWLAGAKGVNAFAPYGMSWLARALAALFGAPLWKIAFWTPAFLGSLTAIVCTLWGWLLAGRRGALATACLGAVTPGFFFRSRLGYYDSDVFTLLMPLLIGFFLAHLLSFCCTRAWLASPEERAEGGRIPSWLPWLALGYGLVARFAHFAHDDIQPMGVMLFWLALVVAAITARPGMRLKALQLLVIYALAGYAGFRLHGISVVQSALLPSNMAGIAAAAGLAYLVRRGPQRLRPALEHPWVWLAALLVLAAFCDLLSPLGPFWVKAMSYFKPMTDAGTAAGTQAAASGPVYPGITQSIREAKNVANWATFFAGISMSPWVGGVSLLGVGAIFIIRPAMVFLLPLAAIGLSSLFMGVRFAMFGGPVFTLGLGVGAHWLAKALLHRTGAGTRSLVAVQAVIAAIGLIVYAGIYSAYAPTPVLAPQHALALKHLKTIAPKGTGVWTWWDFGYATQYYAERMTPTDGGKHTGRDIYPTALALTTPSFRQAAQVILLSAGQGGDPARRWDKMAAKDVRLELESLAAGDVPMQKPATQYLVVSWDNMNLLHWIDFYGTWDVATGSGTHAKTQVVDQAFRVDTARGGMVMNGPMGMSAPIPLSSLDRLTTEGARRLNFPANPGGPHLIVNDVNKKVMLLDDLAYDSMAVQLLIGDPARPELTRYFKLVHEGFPLVRIYEVLPPAKEPTGQAEAFTQ
jgi:dolichyl-diphosphooligosaccharide--protein glycosyltransferase